MTPKEKDLLLKDLCSRLPYRVKCLYKNNTYEILSCLFDKVNIARPILSDIKWVDVELIKPYLRPMSSMTEEEKIESLEFAWEDDYGILASYNENIPKYIDWLNKKMFDYRELIDKGLALEAPNEMYYG